MGKRWSLCSESCKKKRNTFCHSTWTCWEGMVLGNNQKGSTENEVSRKSQDDSWSRSFVSIIRISSVFSARVIFFTPGMAYIHHVWTDECILLCRCTMLMERNCSDRIGWSLRSDVVWFVSTNQFLPLHSVYVGLVQQVDMPMQDLYSWIDQDNKF